MTTALIECVPNFSEGRELAKIDRIVEAIAGVGGILVLDRESDPDHNRSVLTFAGPPEAVLEASVRAAGEAARLIDLNVHRGEHPRIGAMDVLPFVPLRGASMEECAALAVQAGERIWRRWRVPIYLYGEAARQPERRNLADIRRGGFEALREEARRGGNRRPDIGGPELHPTAGAVAAGARKILVAYNIQLASDDLAAAKAIARRIRESSGGLPCVKAMGVRLASRGQVQVSMNLTDYEVTPPHAAFAAVEEEARRLGIAVDGSEVIGLAPRRAMAMARADLRLRGSGRTFMLEDRLEEAIREAKLE